MTNTQKLGKAALVLLGLLVSYRVLDAVFSASPAPPQRLRVVAERAQEEPGRDFFERRLAMESCLDRSSFDDALWQLGLECRELQGLPYGEGYQQVAAQVKRVDDLATRRRFEMMFFNELEK
jgi:hypothetical protein